MGTDGRVRETRDVSRRRRHQAHAHTQAEDVQKIAPKYRHHHHHPSNTPHAARPRPPVSGPYLDPTSPPTSTRPRPRPRTIPRPRPRPRPRTWRRAPRAAAGRRSSTRRHGAPRAGPSSGTRSSTHTHTHTHMRTHAATTTTKIIVTTMRPRPSRRCGGAAVTNSERFRRRRVRRKERCPLALALTPRVPTEESVASVTATPTTPAIGVTRGRSFRMLCHGRSFQMLSRPTPHCFKWSLSIPVQCAECAGLHQTAASRQACAALTSSRPSRGARPTT